MVPGRAIEPPRAEAQRILSSTVGSERFGKFSTLLDSSTACKHADSHRHDPICRVLSMELLQFYYTWPEQPGALTSIINGLPHSFLHQSNKA
jgi:hypothetical protein